jgi:S-DNA-T family DNA segregation ATPase FtsK/SpoIIIE
MMRRYKAMSDAGVRDLESFNAIVESEGEGVKLPQVVVIIDELADLMMVAAKEVEESICRIAQMGRASGIHLVIATQRPSADVITGLMKANIPSRIAFSVASAMESRIILDTMGAEKLVGKGDMLFAPIGSGKPMRVQGCFVSDAEVEAVATYVKENFNTDYDNAIMEDIEKRASQAAASGNKGGVGAAPEANDAELEGDEMLPAAVDVILETNQASVSMLQRRLKLGYARAARIVDEMEEKGIVGPFQGSKPREILITKEQWATMRGNQPEQMELDDIPFDEGVPEELD